MKRFIAFAMALTLVFALTGCSEKNVNENAAEIIKAMVFAPNDTLFDPDAIVSLGLGVQMSEGDRVKAEHASRAMEKAWEDAVGDCFEEGYFEKFLTSGGAYSFLTNAYTLDLTYKVTEIKLNENTDLGQSVKVVYEVNDKEVESVFELEIADSGLIRTVTAPRPDTGE